MMDCGKALDESLMEEYELVNVDEFASKLKAIFTYSYDRLEKMASEHNNNVDLAIYGKLISFGGSDEEKRQQYEHLRESFLSSIDQEIIKNNLLRIKKRVVSSKAWEAYEFCIAHQMMSGLSATIRGNPLAANDRFFVKIDYVPAEKDDPDTLIIKQVEATGASPASGVLIEGAVIESYTGLTLPFNREGDKAIFITIHIKGRQSLDVESPEIPIKKKTPAPTAKLIASKPTITFGQEVELEWQTTDAEFVFIDNGPGEVKSSGHIRVKPTTKTRYTLTASGPSGKATSGTVVDVNPRVRVYEHPHRGGARLELNEPTDLTSSAFANRVSSIEVFTDEWVRFSGITLITNHEINLYVKGPKYIEFLSDVKVFNRDFNDIISRFDIVFGPPSSSDMFNVILQ